MHRVEIFLLNNQSINISLAEAGNFALPLLPGHLAGPYSLLKTSTKRIVLGRLKRLDTESEDSSPPNAKDNNVLPSSSHISSCLIKYRANFTYLFISGLIFVNTDLLTVYHN